MLPLIALSGAIICCRWGWLGFAAVSVALVGVAACQLYVNEPSEWPWIVVLTISILSALIAALLALANSREGWELFDVQYSALQGEAAKLQEQLQAAQGILGAERTASATQTNALQDQLAKGEEKIVSYERLLALVREELSSGYERQEKLVQELSSARQHAGALEQRIAAMQAKAVKEQHVSHEKARKLYLEQEQKFLTEMEDSKHAEYREQRRIEGLYHQLQGQFAEKSKILDDTRRELFHAQEKAAVLQKDMDEVQKFGVNNADERLYKMLASLEREMELKERSARSEISALEDIVSILSAPKE